jgi:hypothetical protein
MLPWFASFAKQFVTGGRRPIDLKENRHSFKDPFAKTTARFQLPHELMRLPSGINHPRPKGRGIHLMIFIDFIAAFSHPGRYQGTAGPQQ